MSANATSVIVWGGKGVETSNEMPIVSFADVMSEDLAKDLQTK